MKSLYEFKAGRMILEGKTVTADPRNGKVLIFIGDDELMHFCWRADSSSTLEEDLILFPQDAFFTKVEQCKDERVYLLKFNTSSLRKFFWIQEKDDFKIAKQVNEIINSKAEIDLNFEFNSTAEKDIIVDDELSVTASDSSNVNSSKIVTLANLQNILSKVKVPNQTTLTSLLSFDKIRPLLLHAEFVEKLFQLIPQSAPKTKEEIESVLKSPQFLQTVSTLDEALKSHEIPQLMVRLGLDPSVCQEFQGVDALLEAIKRKKQQESK